MVFGFACYELPSLGHEDHLIRITAVGFVVVGGIEEALLVCALLGGNGGGDRAAQRMEAPGCAGDKLAVAVAVEGIDILKVDVEAVVALFVDEGDHIVQQPRLHPLVRQEGVGNVGGKAAFFADVRDRQDRRGLGCVGCLDETPILDGAQLPLRGRLIREGAKSGEVRQALIEHFLTHIGIDVGVDLDLLPHVDGRTGDHKALPDDEA